MTLMIPTGRRLWSYRMMKVMRKILKWFYV